MSMDLFFFMATFLCRDERELRTFAQRVVFSILVAAAFFLLLPLKLDWPERPSRRRMVRGLRRAVMHGAVPDGISAQPISVAAYRAVPDRGGHLRPAFARDRPGSIVHMVYLDRYFHAVDLAAPCGGRCGRIDAGRVRILRFPRIRLALPRDAERPGRLLLRRGSRDGADAGEGGRPLGRVPALARGRAGDHSRRLFRSRTGDLPQNRRPAALEHAVRAGSDPDRAVLVARLLSPSMSCVGRSGAGGA